MTTATFDHNSHGEAGKKRVAAPVQITNGVAQLFIDDVLIDSQTNLKRTLHQPKKDNGGNAPILAFDNE